MSISTATDRLASPRRVQPRRMLGAVLLGISLIAVLVAIAISSTTSSAGRVSARPGTINARQSHPAAQPTGDPVSSVPRGTFRDPVTRALLPVGTPTASQAEPGLGHR
jgi:hypothetical protein